MFSLCMCVCVQIILYYGPAGPLMGFSVLKYYSTLNVCLWTLNSISTVLDGVMKLHRHLVEVKMKAKFKYGLTHEY